MKGKMSQMNQEHQMGGREEGERRKSVGITRTKIRAFIICHVDLHIETPCPLRKSSVYQPCIHLVLTK